MPTRSVLFCDRELDVDRGEDGEDVCLQDRDQHLEEGEVGEEGVNGNRRNVMSGDRDLSEEATS